MVDTIRIDVDNFGLIDSGEFEISQIGILKGMKGHGRADFNKLLFAFLITVSAEGVFAANNMVKIELYNAINTSNLSFEFMMEFNDFINNNWNDYDISPKYLNMKYEEYKKILKKHNVKFNYSRIKEVLGLFDEYKRYRSPIFRRMVDVEFKNYSFEKYADYEVNIYLDDYQHFIKNENDQTNIGISYETPILPGNVLYLGPRPIMDFDNNMPYHYEELYSNMTQTHVKCQKDIGDICDEIEDLIDGSFEIWGDFEFYTNDNENIDLNLLSREIKQFGVILYLLENEGIPEKSVMILDRIDKDMSENYQNKLAEILVKLTLRLDLILLINTDSDNFIKELDKFKGDVGIKTYEAVEKGDKYIFH